MRDISVTSERPQAVITVFPGKRDPLRSPQGILATPAAEGGGGYAPSPSSPALDLLDRHERLVLHERRCHEYLVRGRLLTSPSYEHRQRRWLHALDLRLDTRLAIAVSLRVFELQEARRG